MLRNFLVTIRDSTVINRSRLSSIILIMDSQLEPITETEEGSFCTQMMKRLAIQRRNEQFCDVILEVGSGDDQARLHAHRNVLCAASPFFYNALNSDMKEKKEGVIRLEQTSKTTMELVLNYLYSGRVEVTKDNSYELFAQADYFLIPSLKTVSGEFISQTTDVSNCILTYNFAIKYQCEELQKAARDFIFANFVAVAGTEDFLNLSGKEVEEWISSDEIIVKEEEEVFQVIAKWMEKSRNREDVEFFQLLRHVRCIYVSCSNVFSVILNHPLVKASSACNEFVLNAMKEVFSGTDECFFNQPPRHCLKTHEDVIVASCGKWTLCYHPFEEKWYELESMLTDTSSCQFDVSSVHSKLFCFGGDMSLNSIAQCYDPSHNLWLRVKAPETVRGVSAVVTLQGYLYIVGGRDKNDKNIRTVERYNPDTDEWKEVASLSCPRSGVCTVTDGNYLYAIGGYNDTYEKIDIVERFDPSSNNWDNLPSTHAKRAYACGTAIRGKVFVFGGLSGHSTAEDDPFEIYDPTTNTWSSIPSLVAPRQEASVVSFKGQIYVLGCFHNAQNEDELALQVYDIDKNKWKHCPANVPDGEFFQISALRISRDVLTRCKLLNSDYY